MPDTVSLTINVSPEQAAYILSLVSLWSNDEVELNKALIVLPALIRDIAYELNMCSDFSDPDIIHSLKWDNRDVDTLNKVIDMVIKDFEIPYPLKSPPNP